MTNDSKPPVIDVRSSMQNRPGRPGKIEKAKNPRRALTRMVLKDVNIASTTALQTLRSDGRELGLRAGANVIMPNITQTQYRSDYQLYDGKACLDENAAMCRDCLRARIESLGETIGYGQKGDSLHFKKKCHCPPKK